VLTPELTPELTLELTLELTSNLIHFITALHEMQMQYSDKKAVRLTVCLSVRLSNAYKAEERSLQIFAKDHLA